MNVEEIIKTEKKIPLPSRTIIHLSLVANKINEIITNKKPNIEGAKMILKLLIPALLIAIISDSELNFKNAIVADK